MDEVEIGIYIPQLGFGYHDMLRRAEWVEELGFHSLWMMDHLYPPGLPDVPSLEAFTLATALLARTSRIRVGHMVLCNNFRHPALVAKMATTLALVSDDRFVIGLGSGSFAAEHTQAGMPWGTFSERTERLADALEIIGSMLRTDRTTYQGQHYSVTDLPNLPHPARTPPILVGGGGARTLKLVARHADIWNCATYDLQHLTSRIAALDDACREIGRDPSSIRLSLEAVLALGATTDDAEAALRLAERRYGGAGFGLRAGGMIGTPDQVIEQMKARIDQGISLFVFFMHDRGDRRTLELLAKEVLPAIRSERAISRNADSR